MELNAKSDSKEKLGVLNKSNGPIEWSYVVSESEAIDLSNRKPLPYILNKTMLFDHKKNKELGIQCSYHISSAWLGQRGNIYNEALRFFCEDKKTGNVFDYGIILQCDTSSGMMDASSPAVYNTNEKKLKILNLNFECRSRK